jgi:hypothetical protein
VPRPGYQQTIAGARASLEEFERLAGERERPLALIVIVDRVLSQDSQSRKLWAEASPRLRAGLALVCRSPLSRAIASFFIGLRRPSYPLARMP